MDKQLIFLPCKYQYNNSLWYYHFITVIIFKNSSNNDFPCLESIFFTKFNPWGSDTKHVDCSDFALVLLQQCRLVSFVMLLIVGGHSAVSPGMQMTFNPHSVQIKEKSRALRQSARAEQQIWLGERTLASPTDINLSNNNARHSGSAINVKTLANVALCVVHGAAEAQTQEKVGGRRESIFHIFLPSLVGGVLIPGGKEWHINYLNAAITLHIAASNYIAALMLFSRRSPKK